MKRISTILLALVLLCVVVTPVSSKYPDEDTRPQNVEEHTVLKAHANSVPKIVSIPTSDDRERDREVAKRPPERREHHPYQEGYCTHGDPSCNDTETNPITGGQPYPPPVETQEPYPPPAR